MVIYGLILVVGALVGWLVAQAKVQVLKADNGALRVRLEEEGARLTEAFRAISADALAQNNQSFLDLAKTSLEKYQEGARSELDKRSEAIDQLIKPVKSSLEKFDTRIQELDKQRVASQATLTQQLTSLVALQQQLKEETTKISSALKSTTVRGRWGEIQLKRIVELAGMIDHCDFHEQQSADSEEGRRRPDLIVNLPGGRQIIVDAKAPLDAYLEACETDNEQRRSELMTKHAQQIRLHIRQLASKSYSEAFTKSAEFVVLFLPGEAFFSAALAQDPSLIEAGADQSIILATPTTLIALLRAVYYGWRQEAISQNAQKISALGRDLYKRLATMSQHWARVGKGLTGAISAYNETVGSLERRVLPKAREFEKLESSNRGDQLAELPTIEQTIRPLSLLETIDE